MAVSVESQEKAPLTRELPFQCPHCQERAGFPIGMTTEAPDREVIVARCRKCAHMWQLQRRLNDRITRRW
jgi:DNA-directed RNA polymerase subunit M/transcription elongation factor TFIIS